MFTMPSRLFIQKKRKSFGQDDWDNSLEGGQKRRCFGSLDYSSDYKFSGTNSQDLCWDELNDDMNDDLCHQHNPVSMESNNNSYNNHNYNLPNSLVINNTDQSLIQNQTDHPLPQQKESSALTNGCDMELDCSEEIETCTSVTSATSSSYYEQLNVLLGPSDRFCVGGTFIHRPGLNRSYCKPSWDAMTDMRPYVSDYY